MFGPYVVMQYSVLFLVLQSSHQSCLWRMHLPCPDPESFFRRVETLPTIFSS